MEIFDILNRALEPGMVYRGDDASMTRYRSDVLISMSAGTNPAAIVLPKTVEQLATTLKLCHEQGTPVTPQGGLTGVVGGAVPTSGGVALSVERMRSIIELDADAATMTVEAGAPLQAVQTAAEDAGFLFPLDLGARGSCAIGGNAATNAGGNRVLRYGMMRDLVLGIEVVLADGTIVTSLNKMLKNNAGYDVKHLFLGSEGTLGVITKLVLRLFPKPTSACTAFCGVDSYANAMKLLARCRNGLAGTLSAFEVMWPGFYELAQKAVTKLPLAAEHSYYVLLDALGSDQESDQARFQQLMENALEDGIVTDAVIAQSGADSASLWAVRDCVAEFPRLLGRNASFDISIPTGKINDFIEACDRRLAQHTAQPRTVWFGHVADSNVHLMARCEETLSKDAIEALVYETVRDWHGSVSAEHGIGLAKRPYLGYSRSPAELEVMHMLKAALDPRGILNPGKVLPLENPLDAQR